MPYIQLKASRLLYDVRSSKPAINIKESVFYNQIEGYSIRIGAKERDGITIHNVLIYDHTANRGNVVQMYAKDGKFFTTPDKKFLDIVLYNGTHYEQPINKAGEERTRPNSIMNFKEQDIKIDISQIKMQQTDEARFKNNAEMMDLRLLSQYTDTLVRCRTQTYAQTYKQFSNVYYFARSWKQIKQNDSLHIKQVISLNDYMKKLSPDARKKIIENALNIARNADSFMANKIQEEDNQVKDEARFSVEWHKKFTVACACIIMFFVGSPLGAIVRKGGFGMPVVISVIMFLVYYVITITCEKMVLEDKLNGIIGMWIGAVVFLPIGIWLSLKAANDSPLFDMALYTDFIKKIFRRNNAIVANNQ